jgi:phosphoesterase RecJ-like protein
MKMGQPPSEIVRLIHDADSILVMTHVHPDGDALGSQLALGNILESLGKKVFLYGETQPSHLYEFLPGCDKIGSVLPPLAEFSCGMALDCGDRYRLGTAMADLLALPVIVIDHHSGHKEFGGYRWLDPERASTGEMIFDLGMALGADISYETAYCLYAAIVSDTGSFKYPSTTADTFRIAGELVSKGVQPGDVAGKLFDNFTVSRLRLLKMVLDSLELHAEDRIAIITARREMFSATGARQEDTENFINYPRSVDTVKVSAFLKEAENGVVGVSLRSKGRDCDVAQIAASFGGGGHRNAAGFKVAGGNLSKVREELLAELLRLMESGAV